MEGSIIFNQSGIWIIFNYTNVFTLVGFHNNYRLQMYKTVVMCVHRNIHIPTHAQHRACKNSAVGDIQVISRTGL